MNKTKDRYNDDRLERDYMIKVHLNDARTWFRYRNRMKANVKTKISPIFSDNME